MENLEKEKNEMNENSSEKATENTENIENNEEKKEFSEEELFIQALENIRKESKENHEKYVRLNAESVNYKTRVEKEKIELIQYSGKEILKAMLPFIDTFDSAIKAEHKNLEETISGFNLVYDSLVNILKKEGLEKINALNEKFNPEFHDAIGFDNNPDLDDNIVTMELQAGYKLKEKVLRHAMVKVNKK